MRVTLICHNVSENCLGRAYMLALAIRGDFDVEVAGPLMSGDVWPPLRGDTRVPIRILPRSPRRAAVELTGNVLYPIKPRAASLGTALLAQRHRPRPLLLDIDDWELGFYTRYPWPERLARGLVKIADPNSLFGTALLDRHARRVRHKTVSNRFLQDRFGGDLIPHFRDTDELDPKKYDRAEQRRRLGLGDERVILFMGTIRAHKGVDALVEAIAQVRRRPGLGDVILLLVGVDRAAESLVPPADFVRTLPPQPVGEIPRFLSVADLVVLYQQPGGATAGQLPAKVFDAMAMARPIIASDIGDLPAVLADTGRIVSGRDPAELTAAIAATLSDPAAAAAMGWRARQRCVADYSEAAVRPRLRAAVHAAIRAAAPGSAARG